MNQEILLENVTTELKKKKKTKWNERGRHRSDGKFVTGKIVISN